MPPTPIFNKIVIFEQDIFYYKLNRYLEGFTWHGTKACKKKNLKSPQWIRNIKNKKFGFWRLDTFFSETKYINKIFIKKGGWHFSNIKSAEDWKKFDDFEALQSLLNWEERLLLDKLVPAHFVTPLQRKIRINYENNVPEISIRIQEMYGQKTHPTSAELPIRITFLSPAGRKIQTTTDIVSFWESSYEDVRKDMRGRYPKHFWPERPADSQPTLNTKNKI